MALRLRDWKRLLLNLSAGAFLCASVGCKTPANEGGPQLNGPKTMGPGNQVQLSPKSPAFNNLNGQSGVANNFSNGQMNNSSAMMQRNNPSTSMQGVQLPPMNQVPNTQGSFGQQNPQLVMPTQFGQQGLANNGVPQSNQMQSQPNQMQIQPNQMQPNFQQQGQPNLLQLQPNLQPPMLNNNQGPAFPINNQSMNELRIPDSLPTSAREVVDSNGPSLMPSIPSQPTPTLEPAPTAPKEPTVRVVAEYTSPRKTGEAAKVVTTPVEHQPVLEAPITPLR